ncbi:MAG TPA: aminopeptidase N C-terminal domain-containing protein, partial [Paracoccaceae bacterium]|nr:aminopeptidase N C-terminal domain-containing protein [Paracoccaceae bacterium]
LIVSTGDAENELHNFYKKWQQNRLVIDKWYILQATATPPEQAVETVQRLSEMDSFDWKNPNRFRALLSSFAMGNPAGFHAADGRGYNLFADWLIRLDPVNPQVAARQATAFETWRRYDANRQNLMKSALRRIADTPKLSKDTTEIVGRILG